MKLATEIGPSPTPCRSISNFSKPIFRMKTSIANPNAGCMSQTGGGRIPLLQDLLPPGFQPAARLTKINKRLGLITGVFSSACVCFPNRQSDNAWDNGFGTRRARAEKGIAMGLHILETRRLLQYATVAYPTRTFDAGAPSRRQVSARNRPGVVRSCSTTRRSRPTFWYRGGPIPVIPLDGKKPCRHPIGMFSVSP